MKKIIIPISTLFVVGLSHAQALNLSTDQNYVYSKTYLDYDTNNQAIKATETVQYLDGLGRPKQVVNIKASPLQRDIVSHIEYDGFGRQALDYLPVPQGGTMNGAIVPNPLANASNTPLGNEVIFAKKEFENSPLDRILEQKQVGQAWSDKPVKFNYDANIDGEVKKFTATFDYTNLESKLTLSTSYTIAQLYKNMVTDEDGNKTIEYKNGRGQVLLIRKVLSDTENADTYYVYNNYDQLAYVIPPLAADAVKNLTSGLFPDITLNNLCYQYKYDSRNRLVEKKLPGKGWEYMVYDKTDRLIFTQDAVMHPSKKWLFTKYDQFGRVAYTGVIHLPGQTREELQAITNNQVITEKREGSLFSNGILIFYSNDMYSQIETVLSVNYYDNYPRETPPIPSQILGQDVLSQYSQNSNISTKSLPVASYVKNIEDDNWTKNYTWYDQKGRPIGSHSINHLGGYTKTESELDFSGTPKMVVTRHKRLDSDTEKVITENFTYDHQNRLMTHTHKVDNNPVEYLAQNIYNELSQLESKKVGGTSLGSGLQQVDYLYNIRGWMTQINDPGNLVNGDLFGYKIKYNQVEGEQTPNNDFSTLQVKPKYNGNIAEIDWKTSTQENEPLKRYGYVYDGLNRLKAGFYQKDINPTAKEYFEKIDYDLNGNIMRLQRSAELMTGNTAAFKIDNLKYDYIGNRLTKVTEEEIGKSDGYPYLASHNTIEYDNNVTNGNGNMTKHLDKGISSIQYNYLNLPKQITQNAQITNYIYRADGVKVKKLFGDIETNYLDGFQYKSTKSSGVGNGGGFGTIDDPNEVAVMKLRIIPTSEGYFDALSNQYIYNYTDHLGNVRLSYSDTNKDGIVQARQYFVSECNGNWNPPFEFPICIDNWKPGEIVEINNYYPFGLLHNYTTTTQNAYQYKYNGKELQETGMYDYGARMYMPDIGRWGVIDPLAEVYRRHSPYNYVVNNPIRFIDPDGMRIRWASWGDVQNDEELSKTFSSRKEYREARRELKKQYREVVNNSETASLIYNDLEKDSNTHTIFATKENGGSTVKNDDGGTTIKMGIGNGSDKYLEGVSSLEANIQATVAHEGGHAWLKMKGIEGEMSAPDLSSMPEFKISAFNSYVENRERRASHIENIIRGELINNGIKNMNLSSEYSAQMMRYDSKSFLKMQLQTVPLKLLENNPYNANDYLNRVYKISDIK
ncbi:DUF6443 domain-containing protein [Chryseobacterium turcicum]|uniref:RHS repeat-associated core domain-containing protein n=1 Tax=Chryseobacterium turcicum TaxID=2898076 RepID=A0A9Q3V4B8_9FLAO|nr:DUF6443 domain-containing protein [Chryseobacterium turcicum]MCD1117458.1 RHS repeat-associated core domain-containing protein [Chryseobacterium turcicum]